MTVETNASSVTLAGNGATTSWPFAFLIPGAFDGDQSNVVLTVVDETVTPAVTTTILPGAYTITGVGNPAGGAVTYPLSGSPLAANMFITTQRVLAVVQSTEISNQGGFYPQVLEAALDYLTMLTQQQQAQIARSLQTAVTDPSGALQNIPVSRANTFLAFDANGQPIASAGPPATVPISAAMLAVVQAASLLLGRAALAVPGLADNNTFTGTQTFDAATIFATSPTFSAVVALSVALNEARATIASAATTNIGAAAANYLQVTGAVAITAFDVVQAGARRVVEFAGALTLTNSASILLPGGANILTAAGDVAVFVSEGAGVWRCTGYTPATGKAVIGSQLNKQAIPSSTTFTAPAGTTLLTVYKWTIVGGGGGGASVNGGGGSEAGGGGGAGGTSVFWGSGIAAGATVVVTVAGSAGAGTNGGNSSIVFNGTTVTGLGGVGGGAPGTGASTPGGAGGGATGGNILLAGGAGGPGVDIGASNVTGGQGGSSMLGGAGLGGVNGGGTGGGGSNGGGGGGASVTSGNGTATGGSGGPGLVIVEWVQ